MKFTEKIKNFLLLVLSNYKKQLFLHVSIFLQIFFFRLAARCIRLDFIVLKHFLKKKHTIDLVVYILCSFFVSNIVFVLVFLCVFLSGVKIIVYLYFILFVVSMVGRFMYGPETGKVGTHRFMNLIGTCYFFQLFLKRYLKKK